jgi:hypothetical protein
MQNEFEKQVQKKMEELKLVPSDPVWQKVEEQIRKKKERRRFFFFFLPSTALLIAATWWLISDNSHSFSVPPSGTTGKPSASTHASVKKDNKDNNEPDQPSEVSHQIIQQKAPENNNNGLPTERTNTENKPGQGSISATFTSVKNTTANKKITAGNSKATVQISKPGQNKIATNKKTHHAVASQATISSFAEANKNGNQVPESTMGKPEQNSARESLKDSTTIQKEKAIDKPASKTTADTSAKKKIAGTLIEKKKWEKFITVQTGASAFTEGIFKSDAKSMRSLASIGNPPPGVVSPTHYPTQPMNGFSFAVGAGVIRNMGERFEVDASIQYHLYTASQEVGKKVTDSAGTYDGTHYYTNEGGHQYTNKYGMIEIPVRISFQLIKKVPVHFAVGASYNRMVNSNALSFDYTNNTYYHDKENLFRNFTSIFSSIQFRFHTRNKTRIAAGPIVQFIPKELQKESSYTIPHLYFAGLKADISF